MCSVRPPKVFKFKNKNLNFSRTTSSFRTFPERHRLSELFPNDIGFPNFSRTTSAFRTFPERHRLSELFPNDIDIFPKQKKDIGFPNFSRTTSTFFPQQKKRHRLSELATADINTSAAPGNA
jgi:hypothetical protein